MLNSPLSTLIPHAWKLLRTEGEGSDLEAMREDFIMTLFTQANMEYLEAMKDGGTGPIALIREAGFTILANTAINEAGGVATTDTEFTVDESADADATDGAFVIWDSDMPDVGFYAANASDTLSGVSGLGFDHDDNDVLQWLYKLPANFGNFRAADGYGDGVQVNGRGYRFVEGTPGPGQFTSRTDGTNTFLWLPKGLSGKAAVNYEKSSATLDSLDDTVDAPPEDEFFLVWRVVDLALFPKKESELRAEAKIEWRKKLRAAVKRKNVSRQIRVRPIGRRMDRETYSLTHQEQ